MHLPLETLPICIRVISRAQGQIHETLSGASDTLGHDTLQLTLRTEALARVRQRAREHEKLTIEENESIILPLHIRFAEICLPRLELIDEALFACINNGNTSTLAYTLIKKLRFRV